MQFCIVDEPFDFTIVFQQSKRLRNRVHGNVGTAHVEQPGNIVQQGDGKIVDAFFFEQSRHACTFSSAWFTTDLIWHLGHNAARCCRAIGPDGIERVVIDGNQVATAGAQAFILAVYHQQRLKRDAFTGG
ncbi:hypothetical protein D3C75_722070 [compost metagenome]